MFECKQYIWYTIAIHYYPKLMLEPRMPSRHPDEVVSILRDITPCIHSQALDLKGKREPLDRFTHGMCDFYTAAARRELRKRGIDTLHVVGINIPVRTVNGRETHASHTIGIVHQFVGAEERTKAVWFDYSCAQYGFDQEAIIEIVEKEDVYQRLREVYGGGQWEPGGSYLSQLNLDPRAKVP